MSSKMLKKTKNISDSKVFSGLCNGYAKFLEKCLKIKPVIIIAVFALLGLSFAAAISRGTAFMPEMDSTQLSINVELDDKASLEDTAKVTDELIARITKMEDIQDVGAMSGSASSMSMLTGSTGGSTNTASVYVTTKEKKSMTNEEIAAQIMEDTKDLNATITIETSTMDMSALGGSGISIQVRGKELDKLQEIAGEVAAIIESVDGTSEVSDGMAETTEELRIKVDKEKAMEYGLTVAQVYSQIQPKLAESQSATNLSTQSQDYGVYVIDAKDQELTRKLVKELTVEGTDENNKTVEVPLEEIVTFETAKGLDAINRTEQTRYIQVSASIAEGYNVGIVSEKVNAKLENYELPTGYSLEFAGENETINEALDQLKLMLLLAVVFMYLIMVAQFQSLLLPFIIMFTIPLAFTGGLFGLYFTNNEVSVISMIGFVMLAGIIVNNGIVLIDYINQLRQEGVEKKEAILQAGKTRLRPVLMTALTTILAMSTMVFSHNMGSDMSRPMAIVVIGGLLYGTLLTLVVIPCVYDLFTGKNGLNEKKNRNRIKKMSRREVENGED